MNRLRLLAIGTTLMLALTTAAQQAPTSSDAHGGSGGGVPTVQEQLKVLTEKLGYEASRVSQLIASGAVGAAPVPRSSKEEAV